MKRQAIDRRLVVTVVVLMLHLASQRHVPVAATTPWGEGLPSAEMLPTPWMWLAIGSLDAVLAVLLLRPETRGWRFGTGFLVLGWLYVLGELFGNGPVIRSLYDSHLSPGWEAHDVIGCFDCRPDLWAVLLGVVEAVLTLVFALSGGLLVSVLLRPRAGESKP